MFCFYFIKFGIFQPLFLHIFSLLLFYSLLGFPFCVCSYIWIHYRPLRLCSLFFFSPFSFCSSSDLSLSSMFLSSTLSSLLLSPSSKFFFKFHLLYFFAPEFLFFFNNFYIFTGSLYLVKHCSHVFFNFINMIFLSYFEYILNSWFKIFIYLVHHVGFLRDSFYHVLISSVWAIHSCFFSCLIIFVENGTYVETLKIIFCLFHRVCYYCWLLFV